ncbi:MAG: hypothetical protein WDW36_006124 [Sanguina aurantia]
MPRADFYLIDKPRCREEPLLLVCELTKKAFAAQQPTLILTRDFEQAEAIDELLWSFDEEVWIPHQLAGDDDDADCAVLIVPPGIEAADRPLLIKALRAPWPACLSVTCWKWWPPIRPSAMVCAPALAYAEGRLTLADALWYAQEKCSATAIVDVATLTGACMVALGTEIAGLFTPSDVASTKVAAAARAAGEKVWRMPLEEGYFEVFKSPIADMTNSGSRMGGAISAAMFLKQYVKDDVEWAHIDMAGPVWNTKTNCATGFGAATLAGWAKAQGAEKQ